MIFILVCAFVVRIMPGVSETETTKNSAKPLNHKIMLYKINPPSVTWRKINKLKISLPRFVDISATAKFIITAINSIISNIFK